MRTQIIEIIERRLSENKNGVKTYASYEKAVSVAVKESNDHARGYMDRDDVECQIIPADYIPVFLPKTQKWAIVFNMSQFMATNKTGGYVSYFAARGHASI